MTSLRGIARWSFALSISAALLIVMCLSAIVYTATGSRWAVELALRSVGNEVRVGAFDGRLGDRFELIDVSIDAKPLQITVARISFRWRPRSLLNGVFYVESTTAERIDLTVEPHESEADAAPPTTLPTPPLPMELKRLDLREVTVHLGDRDVTIDRLSLGALWNATQFALTAFEVEAHGQKFGAAGTAAVGHQPRISARGAWNGAVGGEAGQASLEITGPLHELAFSSTIDTHVSATLSGTINPLADNPGVSLYGTIEDPGLNEDLTLSATNVRVEGSFAALDISIATDASTPQTGTYALSLDSQLVLQGATDDAVTADIEWRAEPRGQKTGPIVGTGRVHYDGKSVRINHATAMPYQTRATGEVSLIGAAPAIELDLGWNAIQFSMLDAQTFIARAGMAKLAGPIDDINIEIESELEAPRVGRVDINADANLRSQHLSLRSLTAAFLGGEFRSSAELDFADAIGGTFEFSGHDIDFSALNVETPSRLKFAGNGKFLSAASGVSSDVTLNSLSGFFRGHAISGIARVQSQPGNVTVHQARLSAGSNRIAVRGTWGKEMAGNFDLRIAELSAFDARFAGTLNGSGTVAGTAALPQVTGQLTARNLRFDRIAAENLSADIDVDMASASDSHVDIDISGVAVDKESLGLATLRGRGNARAHTIRVGLEGEVATFQATTSGSWHEKIWQGSVDALEIKSERSGNWSLSTPSEIAIAADAASIRNTCLISDAASVCIEGSRAATASQAKIALTALPLALTDHYLPASVRLRGATDGTIDLDLAQGSLTGSGRLQVNRGMIERDRGEVAPDKLAIQRLALDFDLLPETIRADVVADIDRWFTLDGKLNADRATGGAITAALNVRSEDIAWVAEFLPELSGSQGALEFSSNIRGTIERPTGRGYLSLTDGSIQIPDMGLKITRLDSEISGDPRAINVDAVLGAGDGTLTLKGEASVEGEKHWRYDLHLDGENFPLVRIPEAEADISPALQLVGDGDKLDITGTLRVPRVLIDVKHLPPSAVGVSEDQIVVAEDGSIPEGGANGSFLNEGVYSDVNVRLGDDISINGFGLQSKLSGDVRWVKPRGSARGSANGAIKIDKGIFKAYGQHMKIQNGRLQFAGPVDNPGLQLQAIRPDLPVKVGVNVTGTVRKPKISLFSEPPLSDANTLSYIVTGRELGSASAGDAAVLTQAALSLGAEESAVVTNQIRNAFGLDELSVATGSNARDTSLVAGKRLSPKLSVRTGFNPFDQIWSFFLNYKLTEHWSIEGESGERQGADLLYSIERESLFGR